MIQIDHTAPDGSRTGVVILAHGEVETPVFMPVGTNGCVKAMRHSEVFGLGYRLILGNTYHLYLRPGIDVIQKLGGLHCMSGWQGNMLTDSGGYQVFSLAGLRIIVDEGVRFQSHIDGTRHLFTPEGVIDFQALMGSDIAMQLDVCTSFEASRKEAERAVHLTTEWLRRSLLQKRNHPGWKGRVFGIVQGNFHRDLRIRSLEDIKTWDPDGLAVGGLSVGESVERFEETLSWVSDGLDPCKPRYVMGIGTPDLILAAVAQGVDMFDCVYPTRIARNGIVMTHEGTLDLMNRKFRDDADPIAADCGCTACRTYSRAYLRHLFKAREILAPMLATEHNLAFMARFLREIRNAIRQDSFPGYRKKFLVSYGEE